MKLTPGINTRNHFPIFNEELWKSKGRYPHLAYLDTAASAQKPLCVIDRIKNFMCYEYGTVRRGAYHLSGEATLLYEGCREAVKNLIKANSTEEIIFVKNSTEGINLVARSIENLLRPGDTILLTLLEHHSNIVPWQMLEERLGIKIAFVDILPSGEINIEDYTNKVNHLSPKLVAITQLSNSLGIIPPLDLLIPKAKEVGALVLVDGCQGICHLETSVQTLGCDFYVFSGHKFYGPTGIGVLWGKSAVLSCMEPFLGGGDMISHVSTEGFVPAELPSKFEAGTPPIVEVIGLAEAIKFFSQFNISDIYNHEHDLCLYALDMLESIPGIDIHAKKALREHGGALISFCVSGAHPHDVATIADNYNVQIRAGHHCALPTLKRLGLNATNRLSFGIYSVKEDVERLKTALLEVKRIFSS